MVPFHLMSAETFGAWESASERLGFIDLSGYRSWMPVEVAAVLFFWLRELPDDPAIFPRGKWASIQCMQELTGQAVMAGMEELKANLEARWGR